MSKRLWGLLLVSVSVFLIISLLMLMVRAMVHADGLEKTSAVKMFRVIWVLPFIIIGAQLFDVFVPNKIRNSTDFFRPMESLAWIGLYFVGVVYAFFYVAELQFFINRFFDVRSGKNDWHEKDALFPILIFGAFFSGAAYLAWFKILRIPASPEDIDSEESAEDM